MAAAAPDHLAKWRQEALRLLNEDRRTHDLPALEAGTDLDKAAQAHAEDMARRNYYAHVTPGGKTVQDRYIAAGGSKWELVEENIARCMGCRSPIDEKTIEDLQQGWMHSPEHRANILRHGIVRLGFGIVLTPEGVLYAVQDFAGPGTPRGVSASKETTVVAGNKLPARMGEMIDNARQSKSVGTVAVDAGLNALARSLLPPETSSSVNLKHDGNLFSKLPADEQGKWRSIQIVSMACGGCGTKPTLADLAFFRQQWLGSAEYQRQLLDPDVDGIGFALQANGSGRKVALLVLGKAR